MLVVGRGGIDFVGHGAEAIGFADKAGLLMLRDFTLRAVTVASADPEPR